ncbi:MAG: hypothetical protein IPJ77_22040 [Planctomycetes bacterium]|nr:hypothetical protein [Planctomycetota bacterium]
MAKNAGRHLRDTAVDGEAGGDLRCIAIDWSGARTRERDKLWLAEASAGRVVRLEGGTRTRAELVRHVVELAEREPRLVVGLDFAFSFPAWFLAERGCRSARELWARVAEEGERWLATCPHPFWGRPGRRKPALPAHHRKTESDTPPVKGVGPKSVFQIGGAGAVGTGSVRGMPFLVELASAGFAIWPFDAARFPCAVEIYPRELTGPVQKSRSVGRRAWLANRADDQDAELVRRAATSEDAFDAFASALAMSRHASELTRLAPARDAQERLEGRIWRPVRDPFGAEPCPD